MNHLRHLVSLVLATVVAGIITLAGAAVASAQPVPLERPPAGGAQAPALTTGAVLDMWQAATFALAGAVAAVMVTLVASHMLANRGTRTDAAAA